jgi:hypothetical protein
MPIFAKIAVKAAKKADNNANITHIILLYYYNLILSTCPRGSLYFLNIRFRRISGKKPRPALDAWFAVQVFLGLILFFRGVIIDI